MKKYILEYESFVESVKQGRQYLDQGKIDNETFEKITEIDNSKTKKYVGWLTKLYILKPYDIESLKSYIEEYVVLSDRKLINTDINSFKSIDDLKTQIDRANNIKSASRKELESDYDTIIDNDDFLLIRPNSYEASRKLGLTVFKHRNNEETNQQDSAWCTTYSNRNHWDNYFYENNITFYYGKLKSSELLNKFKYSDLNVFAIAVYENGNLEMYNANDVKVSLPQILINELDISKYLLSYDIDGRLKKKKNDILKLLTQEIIEGQLNLTPSVLDNIDIEINCKVINGTVYITDGFSKIPSFMKKITINGDLYIMENNLDNLENCPQEINGNFICTNNKLKSLKGCPSTINGSFDCASNQLTSLDFAPNNVKYSFGCAFNKIKNLKGAPEIVNENFYCFDNELVSLAGSPQKVKGNYDCSGNFLTNLEGVTKEIGGNFNCAVNRLKTLKYSPKYVMGIYDCSHNEIESLEGVTKEIGGNFNCISNKLSSLKGAPAKVGGSFRCHSNGVRFTKEDVEKVCDVYGNILV